jgi:hypothetical protein
MITASKAKRRKKVRNSISATKQPNYSNEYANWLGTMDWEYMITIRKNYRTTPNMVRNIATKLFKDITDINTLTYVGERDGLDKSNYHLHILINTNDTMRAELQLLKHSNRISKYDTFFVEPIRDRYDAAKYITKHFNWSRKIGDDIVWDLLTK